MIWVAMLISIVTGGIAIGIAAFAFSIAREANMRSITTFESAHKTIQELRNDVLLTPDDRKALGITSAYIQSTGQTGATTAEHEYRRVMDKLHPETARVMTPVPVAATKTPEVEPEPWDLPACKMHKWSRTWRGQPNQTVHLTAYGTNAQLRRCLTCKQPQVKTRQETWVDD
jgi:hypothetical protein